MCLSEFVLLPYSLLQKVAPSTNGIYDTRTSVLYKKRWIALCPCCSAEVFAFFYCTSQSPECIFKVQNLPGERISRWAHIALGWNENPSNIILNLLDQPRRPKCTRRRSSGLFTNEQMPLGADLHYLVLLPQGIPRPLYCFSFKSVWTKAAEKKYFTF
jgi:hypothetical protein